MRFNSSQAWRKFTELNSSSRNVEEVIENESNPASRKSRIDKFKKGLTKRATLYVRNSASSSISDPKTTASADRKRRNELNNNASNNQKKKRVPLRNHKDNDCDAITDIDVE